jgi:protein gp88
VTWRRENRGYPVGQVPGTRIALLSRPEKMPGPSWALPAGPACPFAVYGPGAICGHCLASTGRYLDRVHQRAMHARFDWTRECMRTPAGVDEFVDVMVGAIDATGKLWMRVHDSGDLFSPTYTRAWIRICSALAWVRFWFPTRSWQAPWVSVIVELASLPNVSVRPSALHFGGAPPHVDGLAAGTTVLDTGYSCPAVRNENHCRDCRRCWVQRSQPVSYHAVAGGSSDGASVEFPMVRATWAAWEANRQEVLA